MLRYRQVLREAEKAKKMSERKDYYKILSLDRSADVRDIKRVRVVSTAYPSLLSVGRQGAPAVRHMIPCSDVRDGCAGISRSSQDHAPG